MKKRYPELFVLLLSLLVLTACGSGDGGTPAKNNQAPADPDAFSLVSLKSLAQSHTLSFPSLTGSDSNGVPYNASLTIQTLAPVVIKDVAPTAIPIEHKVTLTNENTNGVTKSHGISFYRPGYVLIVTVEYDQNGNPILTCTPTSYTAPPDSVIIGNSGNFANLTCSDGSNKVVTWVVEAGSTDDDAKIVIIKSTSNGGILLTTEENSYIIDKAGNIKGIEVSIFNDATNVTLNLSGTRQ